MLTVPLRNLLWKSVYHGLLQPALWMAMELMQFRSEKIRTSLQGRIGFWKRLDAAMSHRCVEKPLIWFHVASAGEFLQAQPVIERFMKADCEIVVTYTSVTATKWLERAKFPNDARPLFADFLPLDTEKNMHRLLAILQPSALIYVKFDLWPGLIWKAGQLNVPQYLISATLHEESVRLKNRIARSLYRSVYLHLQKIYCVTMEDLERFVRTCPEHPGLILSGDTRYDSVMDRSKRLKPPPLPPYPEGQRVFIAGSTWPPDEKCIFPGLQSALEQFEDLSLILVPHEPTESHLQPAEKQFASWNPVRLSRVDSEAESMPRVVLVDSVGILSSLYQLGDLAYVGGAFTTGVHNTMEPCIKAMPVLFGPGYQNSPEAIELKERGYGFSVATPEDFTLQLESLLKDSDNTKKIGCAAAKLMKSRCGTADRCFEMIHEEVLCGECPTLSSPDTSR